MTMKWKKDHNEHLVKGILLFESYTYKEGTLEHGNIWSKIAVSQKDQSERGKGKEESKGPVAQNYCFTYEKERADSVYRYHDHAQMNSKRKN